MTHREPVRRRVEHVMGLPVSLALRGRHADDAVGRRRLGRGRGRPARGRPGVQHLPAGLVRLPAEPRRARVRTYPPEVAEVLALGERAAARVRWCLRRRLPGRRRDVLDPSGVVKGWAVERAAAAPARPRRHRLLPLGGRRHGRAARSTPTAPDWRIGIEDPHGPAPGARRRPPAHRRRRDLGPGAPRGARGRRAAPVSRRPAGARSPCSGRPDLRRHRRHHRARAWTPTHRRGWPPRRPARRTSSGPTAAPRRWSGCQTDGHGRRRMGRAVRRLRARLVGRAQPVRRRGVRGPVPRPGARRRRRRGPQRHLVGPARLDRHGRRLLAGRSGQGSPARGARRRGGPGRLAARRRDAHRVARRPRPRRRGLPPARRGRAPRGGASRVRARCSPAVASSGSPTTPATSPRAPAAPRTRRSS